MISFEDSQMFNYNFDNRGSLSLYEFLYQKIRDDIVSGVLVLAIGCPPNAPVLLILG